MPSEKQSQFICPRRHIQREAFENVAAPSATCGQQVLDGVRVLQQPHGVHPQLEPVAVAVRGLGVGVELLQAAHPVELGREQCAVPRRLVQVEYVSLGHIEHPCVKEIIRLHFTRASGSYFRLMKKKKKNRP